MQEKKVTEAESNPAPSMRLPENDAFLYSFRYANWIKSFFTKTNSSQILAFIKKVHYA